MSSIRLDTCIKKIKINKDDNAKLHKPKKLLLNI